MMNAQLQKLIDLQAVDFEIAELEKALVSIPGQLKSAQSGMEAITQELEKARQALADLQKKRKQLEADVQNENDHMAKTKTKLPAVKTNKEYTAILTEVDGIKEKIARIEDQELEIMETLEEKEKQLPPIEARFKEEEQLYKEYKAKKEAEAERAKKELEVVKAKRQELVKLIEPRWAQNYNKVLKAREGQAVVRVRENVCQGCFQLVRPQMVIEVKIGEEIHQCPDCSRFLYWIEEPEEQVETAVRK